MTTKSKTVAQLAAALAGDPKVEQEVQQEIANSSLVSYLLSLRVSKGLTQEQIAESMKCDASKISRLEAGNDANLRWPDLAGYVAALKLNMCLLFEDPSVPLAERIKEYVFRIHKDLEELTALAQQAGDDKLTQKIHQFSGEVLLNFLIRHKDHSEKLRSIVKFASRNGPAVVHEQSTPVAEEETQETVPA
jgi:transcriptional regulator with XRE-family HTH domain